MEDNGKVNYFFNSIIGGFAIMKKCGLELFQLLFFQLVIILRLLATHENPIFSRESLAWPAKSGNFGGTSFFSIPTTINYCRRGDCRKIWEIHFFFFISITINYCPLAGNEKMWQKTDFFQSN